MLRVLGAVCVLSLRKGSVPGLPADTDIPWEMWSTAGGREPEVISSCTQGHWGSSRTWTKSWKVPEITSMEDWWLKTLDLMGMDKRTI